MGKVFLKSKASLRKSVVESLNHSIYSSNKNKKVNSENKLNKENKRCKRQKMRKRSSKDRMSTNLTLFFRDSNYTLKNSESSLKKREKEWRNCSYKENKKKESSSLNMSSKETSFLHRKFLLITRT
jgi:hypothetical protein